MMPQGMKLFGMCAICAEQWRKHPSKRKAAVKHLLRRNYNPTDPTRVCAVCGDLSETTIEIDVKEYQ